MTRASDLPPAGPRIVRIFRGEGTARRTSPTGSVGRVHHGDGFEVVWVNKRAEAIDPDWFVPDSVDVLVVLRGRLKVEFRSRRPSCVLGPGDSLVLPPRTECRAYRWPRTSRGATIFLAVYPTPRARSRPPGRSPRRAMRT